MLGGKEPIGPVYLSEGTSEMDGTGWPSPAVGWKMPIQEVMKQRGSVEASWKEMFEGSWIIEVGEKILADAPHVNSLPSDLLPTHAHNKLSINSRKLLERRPIRAVGKVSKVGDPFALGHMFHTFADLFHESGSIASHDVGEAGDVHAISLDFPVDRIFGLRRGRGVKVGISRGAELGEERRRRTGRNGDVANEDLALGWSGSLALAELWRGAFVGDVESCVGRHGRVILCGTREEMEVGRWDLDGSALYIFRPALAAECREPSRE